MSIVDRGRMFRAWDADSTHQRMAGLASWAAFSARWRAHQGLPLLHPMDVQYLAPADFCNGLGQPLPPEVQRRRFREYVEAAIASGMAAQQWTAPFPHRHGGLASGELGFVRASGFARWVNGGSGSSDVVYGRADMGRYEPEALSPQRPYGVPVVSEAFVAQSSYWLDSAVVVTDGDDDLADDGWIDGLAWTNEE